MTEPKPLQIKLLGPIEICYKHKPLKITRLAARITLYYLAAENRAVSRTELISLLWPETNNRDPRAALRSTLFHLRKELPDATLLITDRLDQVQLDWKRCQVDLVTFQDNFKKLDNMLRIYPPTRPFPAEIVRLIEETLELCQFQKNGALSGDNLDEYTKIKVWQQSLNTHLDKQKKKLQSVLAQHYKASGKPRAALEHFRQVAALDPLDLETQLSIMDLLAGLGQYQEILTYCDSLENIYEKKMNVPLPEPILERYRKVMQQFRQGSPAVSPAWPAPLSMQLQLVGRQNELEKLRKAFYQGGIVAIGGEAGSGKTRLVQELFHTLQPTPRLILAPGRVMENNLPFSPLINSLRRDIPERLWEILPEVWLSHLASLLPELSDYYKPENSLSIENIHQQQIFDSLYHLFVLLAEETGRLLFFLDDAQWVDTNTRQALAYLISQGFFNSYGVLVIAYRTEEAHQDITQFLDHFSRTQTIQHITLQGLNHEELKQLVKQTLDETAPESFIKRLSFETNGNPFIALEIIHTILESSQYPSRFTPSEALPLPANIHSLIRKRLSTLEESERALLTCAAVFGNMVPLNDLNKVFSKIYGPAENQIQHLIEKRYLRLSEENRSQTTYLHFAHEKLREVVLRESSMLKKQRFHRQAAQYLSETSRANQLAAVIANHFLSASDIKPAFDWFIKAANHAWTLGAKDNVLAAYQQAETLFKNAPAHLFPIEDIQILYTAWCHFAYESAQVEMLKKIAHKLGYLGHRENNPLFIGLSQMALSNVHYMMHAFDSSLATISQAIDNLQKTDNITALVDAIIRKGTLFLWNSRHNEAIKTYEEALAICKKANHPEKLETQIFYAKYQLSLVFYVTGNGQMAMQYAEELYEQYFNRVGRFNQMRTLSALAIAQLLCADFESSRRTSLRAIEIAHSLNNSYFEEDVLITLGRAEIMQGKIDAAYTHSQQALHLGEKNQHRGTVIRANCLLGDTFALLHNHEKAEAFYRSGQIEEGFLKNSFQTMEINVHLAQLLLVTGQIDKTEDIIQQHHSLTKEAGIMQLYTETITIWGYLEISKGHLKKAEKLLSEAERIAKTNQLHFEKFWIWLSQSEIALKNQQADKSRNILEKLLKESLEHQSVWTALSALEFLEQLPESTHAAFSKEDLKQILKTLIDQLIENTQMRELQHDLQYSRQCWHDEHQHL